MGVARRIFALMMLSFCLVGAAWGQSKAWWNDDWPYRKQITVDASAAAANIAGSADDVPVLIRLSLANFQYFNNLKPDGSDLRIIADDDSTPLAFHIERFDSQAQIALIWVLLPKMSGGGKTSFYLYYGNSSASTAADVAGTYDSRQVLVYHFGPPKGSPQDATHYKSDPTAFNATVNPASLIGAGASFSGSQTIVVPATGATHLTAAQGYTVSAWVRFAAAQSAADVVQLSGSGRQLILGIAGTQAFARYQDGSAAPVSVRQTTQLTTGDWHHLALTVGSGQLTLYVDGAQAARAAAQAADIAGTLTIGGSADGKGYFTGDMDELEISDLARSADWLKAAATSQGMMATLVAYGTDAQKSNGGGSPSYFVTTLRNVTADGWVIIAILSVMFLAAAGIMASKAFFLSRVARGNARFLAEFRKMTDDPAALEKRLGPKDGADGETESAFEEGTQSHLMAAFEGDGSGFGISTLWRLYHHGIRETMKRLAGQPAGADRVRSLSPQSIEAIRATLDASLTRITQQLNSQMVWLTVAIAGGPFLGLLGTVIGVMITFAAIAASGDVNVNAIAPGTAAALVATVAGLGVAIPCLFGYNYLNTRVKEIGADMRVFVDELVTRIAETYS
jgi:biopolymer transport protein ExbB